MAYSSSSGRITLFWEKSPRSFPWLPRPCSAGSWICHLCLLLCMVSKQWARASKKGLCKVLVTQSGDVLAPLPCGWGTDTPSGMVFLPPQAAHDSSSPWLGAARLLPHAMSWAQPLWCCLGPASLLQCGRVHEERARAMLKQEPSNSQPSLCRKRCPRTYSYPPCTTSHDKTAAGCRAAVGYLHCLTSAAGLAHALCVQAVRDQRGGFPARDAGGICGQVCLAGFTNRGFADHIHPALQLGLPLGSWGRKHLRMVLDLLAMDHQAVLPCPGLAGEKPVGPRLCHKTPLPGKLRSGQSWPVLWPVQANDSVWSGAGVWLRREALPVSLT